MKWSAVAAIWIAAAMLLVCAAADKPPAKFEYGRLFSGGVLDQGIVMSGVRFGKHSGYTRMVLDFTMEDGTGAPQHPLYSIEYIEFPYRLVIKLEGVKFTSDAQIQANPALPFSVITPKDGILKEMQVYLPGPSEIKVIEIDSPAKLSVDVRPSQREVPAIFTVQLLDPDNAQEAFALVERGNFPPGYNPSVLVLGEVVIVEQVYADPAQAAQADAALREMGYASVINQRQGDELPLR